MTYTPPHHVLLIAAASLALAACQPSDEAQEPVRDAPSDFAENEAYEVNPASADSFSEEDTLSREAPPAEMPEAAADEPAHDHDDAHNHDDAHDHEDSAGGEAHVHGHADLAISIDSNRLTVTFDSPLGNLIGFEHEPKDEAQEAELEALQDSFSNEEQLILLPSRADCELTSVSSGTRYRGEHGNLMVEQDFTCRSMRRLERIELSAFSAFPGLESVDAILFDGSTQIAAELTAQQAILQID